MSVLKETNTYRHQLKGRIMKVALEAFIEHGIRAVKMDDIAQNLGISKRTLYETYKDKEELVFESMKAYHEQQRRYMQAYAENKDHCVIDIIMEFYRTKIEELHRVNAAFYTDILQYPRLAAYFKDNKEHAQAEYTSFMQRGVREGYLRPDVNYHIVPYMMDAIGQYFLSGMLLETYSIEELFSNCFMVSLRGLCTEKGLKVIDKTL